MKKVLYVTTVSSTVNAFLLPHIKMLIENGYKIDCAFSINRPLDESLIKLGVKQYEVSFSRNPLSLGNLKAFKDLINLQKENNYDIVHVHTPIASIFGRLLKVKFKKLKTIYTAHGYHFLKGGSKLGWIIYYPIEKIMAKFTDVTININSEDYEITKNKLKPRRNYFINGVGINLDKYKKLSNDKISSIKSTLGLKEKDFVILMIAEINKNKNHIQLIKAMESLKNKYENIKVLCIGDGVMINEIRKEIDIRNLKDNIYMLGYRQDVNDLINISDIGVLMSYREGLPRNIMEFMACGRKVIATNIRGCRDLVCNESIGTLVEVGNFEETDKAIEKYYLLGDRNFIISDEINKYDIKNVNDELFKIYKEV